MSKFSVKQFFRSSCMLFRGAENNIRTRTRKVVSSILTWSSEFFLSFLVLEVFFFKNKKKTCFQLPKPYTSYVHFVHSLKQRSIRWSKKHISSGRKSSSAFRWTSGHDREAASLFMSLAPLHASRISAHALNTLLTLKEKTEDCLQTYVD